MKQTSRSAAVGLLLLAMFACGGDRPERMPADEKFPNWELWMMEPVLFSDRWSEMHFGTVEDIESRNAMWDRAARDFASTALDNETRACLLMYEVTKRNPDGSQVYHRWKTLGGGCKRYMDWAKK